MFSTFLPKLYGNIEFMSPSKSVTMIYHCRQHLHGPKIEKRSVFEIQLFRIPPVALSATLGPTTTSLKQDCYIGESETPLYIEYRYLASTSSTILL